jgi:hypothetical protein
MIGSTGKFATQCLANGRYAQILRNGAGLGIMEHSENLLHCREGGGGFGNGFIRGILKIYS